MSASMEPSAFSEDGKYYSQIGHDGRCKIWDTETNILKQEFTPDLHLSAPLSCLYWIQLDGGTSNPKWKSRKRKSSRPEEENETRQITHCLAFGSTTGKVLIYSLAHAKIESVLEDETPSPGEQEICCMDWSRRNGLYTCSMDSTVRQWSIEDGSVKTKFRMSKFEKGMQATKTTAIKVPNYKSCSRKLLIAAACQIKVWCLDSKSILRTMVGHAGEVCHLQVVPSAQGGKFHILSGSKTDRILSFWSVSLTSSELSSPDPGLASPDSRRRRSGSKPREASQGAETGPACNFLMEDMARCVSVWPVAEGAAEIRLAAVTRRGVVHYYEHILNGPSTKPIKPDTTIQVVSEQKSQVKLAAAVCGTLLADSLLVGYSCGTGLKFERIIPDTTEKTQVLIRTLKEESSKKEMTKYRNEDITRIRHGDSRDAAVVYLTSAIGKEEQDSLKRPLNSKKVDIPMEMRLSNLSLAKSGSGQGPTTNNMAQLLVQALHSKDTKLLQTVFACTDPDTAYNTLNRLPIQYLPALLDHLTSLLSRKTNQCKAACVWATALCRARSAALLQLGAATLPVLAAARARSPCLPHLLALRSRLALLATRATPAEDDAPTLEYRDTSSEDEADDDMEDALMNAANDDSGSWNEDDDEDNASKGSDHDMSE